MNMSKTEKAFIQIHVMNMVNTTSRIIHNTHRYMKWILNMHTKKMNKSRIIKGYQRDGYLNIPRAWMTRSWPHEQSNQPDVYASLYFRDF